MLALDIVIFRHYNICILYYNYITNMPNSSVFTVIRNTVPDVRAALQKNIHDPKERTNLSQQLSQSGVFAHNKYITSTGIAKYTSGFGNDASIISMVGGGIQTLYNLSRCRTVVEKIDLRSRILLSTLQKQFDIVKAQEKQSQEAEEQLQKTEEQLRHVIAQEAFYSLIKLNLGLLAVKQIFNPNGIADLKHVFDPATWTKMINVFIGFASAHPLTLCTIVGTILVVEFMVYTNIYNRAIRYSDDMAINKMIEGLDEHIKKSNQTQPLNHVSNLSEEINSTPSRQ